MKLFLKRWVLTLGSWLHGTLKEKDAYQTLGEKGGPNLIQKRHFHCPAGLGLVYK